AMARALGAIAGALDGDASRARAYLRDAERDRAALEPADRAFVGYLGGIALRAIGDMEDARTTFELAMAAAPGTIGAALARRERSQLAPAQPSRGSSSPQPSPD
ncbi:MAG: hypothetical protein ACRDF0_07180, partial [Candidatus Limnocylindria bacterium]